MAVAMRSSRLTEFDIERLAEMRAAVAQQRHDLGLILDRIELGLHRIGTRRDLGQRETHGQNLDQNYIHVDLRAHMTSSNVAAMTKPAPAIM